MFIEKVGGEKRMRSRDSIGQSDMLNIVQYWRKLPIGVREEPRTNQSSITCETKLFKLSNLISVMDNQLIER